MDEHALRLLSFSSIISELKSYCLSREAELVLDKGEIYTTQKEVEYNLRLATKMRKILEAGKALPALQLPNIGAFVFRLKKQGALLEPQELSDLAKFIHSSIMLKRFLIKEAEGSLQEIARLLPDLDNLKREISSIIDPEGNIIDKKVPVLSSIKGRIKRIHNDIDKLCKMYLGQEGYAQFWQTDLPTVKDGRTVLPLKAQYKGRIKGIIHEVSGSGATIFIEPKEIVEKNNQLVIEENNYKQEVIKILKELALKVRAALPEIEVMLKKIAFLDVLLAKVHYAIVHKCIPAEFSEKQVLLVEARHPLLGEKAVPITVVMDDSCQVLLITGPNTGGKTVSLKTVGLLALMNQFGMEIPVNEGSTLPVFDRILADIGDEQSIEQSLSTFSSHMTAIASITRRASAQSLVLLDELGAGTDPEEGTAIAMSILDHLLEKGPRVIATTHHGILKNYGYMKQGVTNASVDFDTQTLTPTFKLIIGVPGESHALIIAGRNGINESIILKAKDYLNDERTDISHLITQLSKREKDLLILKEQQKQKERMVEEKLRQTELQELRLRQKEYELREYGLKELENLLSLSRKELEKVVKEIRENHNVEENIGRGRDVISQIQVKVAEESKQLNIVSEQTNKETVFKSGMQVMLRDTGKRGVLVRKARGGNWVVETDNVRVSIPAARLTPCEMDSDKQVSISISETSANILPIFELNVRGFRLPEALRQVEKQLDAAVVQGVKSFTILHGKGHGILQTGIHEFLKSSPHVQEYHFASPEQGGSGKTIVVLKQA
jgi:DNA mismatch repair protein MutS2